MAVVGSHERQIIVVRTNHGAGDVTSVTQAWGDDVVSAATDCGMPYKDFRVSSPNHHRLIRQHMKVRRARADLLVFYGHGIESALLLLPDGNGNPQMLVRTSNAHSLLEKKEVCATACWSAFGLGPFAVSHGTISYVGYANVFFLYGPDDTDFRECVNAWIGPILRDHATWDVAVARMREAYASCIAFCQSKLSHFLGG